jgi:hypothetical protein
MCISVKILFFKILFLTMSATANAIHIYNNGDNFIISTRTVVDYFVKIIINRAFNINVVTC